MYSGFARAQMLDPKQMSGIPRPVTDLPEHSISVRLIRGELSNNIPNVPIELQVGMVFALETYCPASDGFSAARIEEEVVVTPDGPRLLTLFPAQDLFVANPY